jgi:hypothetical protein
MRLWIAAMNDDEVIAYIRECLENGNYEWDSQHLDRHMFNEGFDFSDITRAVTEGKIFDPNSDSRRWRFCGIVPRLRHDPRFLGRWLHVSVEYEEGAEVAVVTAYRPRVDEWETETRRR